MLLFCFVIQSTSQLFIISEFYLQRDYIAKNLCVNRFDAIPICKGQCFLNNELNKNQRNQEKNFPDLKFKEIQLFISNISLPKICVTQQDGEIITFQHTKEYPLSIFLFSVFHPPKII